MKGLWIWLVVIIIVILGAMWVFRSQPAAQTPPAPTENTGVTPSEGTESVPATSTSTTASTGVTISYDGNAFSPATVSVKKGSTVYWSGPDTMWVAADEHPTHTEYDGTSRQQHCAAGYTGVVPFDQCASGSTYSFTFTKVGTFEYHDHRHAQATGMITVTE